MQLYQTKISIYLYNINTLFCFGKVHSIASKCTFLAKILKNFLELNISNKLNIL